MHLNLCALRPWFPFKCCKSAFSYSTEHLRPREVQMQANYEQLCFYQLNVTKTRGGNCLFEDKIMMVLSPAWGVGQPHGAQPRVVEMSARGLLRTQNRVAGATEVMAGSLLRKPGCPGSCPEGLGVPSTCREAQGTPYFILRLSLRRRGSENQFSALICYCRPGHRESSSAAEERWAARGVTALPAATGWAETTATGWRFCLGLLCWHCDPSVLLHASCLCSSRSLTHMLKTSVLDNPKIFLKAFLTSLPILGICAEPSFFPHSCVVLVTWMQCQHFWQIGFIVNCLHLHVLKPVRIQLLF